jgi:hypothetical protein
MVRREPRPAMAERSPGNEQLVSASTGAEGRWPRAGYQPSAPAVRVLAGEGLVEVVPGRGAYVTER